MKRRHIFLCILLAVIMCFSNVALADNAADADSLIQKGDALVDQGETTENLEEAMKLYLEATRVAPENEVAFLRVADVFIRQGKYEEAKLFLKSSLITTTEERPTIQAKLDELENGTYTDRSDKVRRREMYDGNGTLLWAHEFTYDNQGRESSLTWLDGAGNVKDVVEVTYDDHGGKNKGYVLIGPTGEPKRVETKNNYDEKGRLVYSITDRGIEMFREYDDNDNLTKQENYNQRGKGELYERYIYEYNNDNQLIRSEYTYFKEGSIDRTVLEEFIYDGVLCTEIKRFENGELSKVSNPIYDESGKQIGEDTYNPEGQLIRSWYLDETGKKIEQDYTW